MEQYGIRFEKLKPGSYPASKLADLISKLERAVKAEYAAKRGEDDEETREACFVSLTVIEDNCTYLGFEVAERLLPSVQSVMAISNNNFSNFMGATKESQDFIREINKTNREFKTKAEMIEINNGKKKVIATLEEEFELEELAKVKSEMSLYGEVISVGGKEPKTRILFDNGQEVSCSLGNDKKLAMKIANLLYKEVRVIGLATCVLDRWSTRLESFKVYDIELFDPPPLNERFDRLTPLIAKQLNRITDLSKYFREMREMED